MTCWQDLSHQNFDRLEGIVVVEEPPEIAAIDLGDPCSLLAFRDGIVASYPVVLG